MATATASNDKSTAFRAVGLALVGGIAALVASAQTGIAKAETRPSALYTVLVGARGELIYEPPVLTIRAGDRVRFINVGGFHNVIADDNSFRCANGCEGDGGSGAPSNAFWSFTLTFNTPGKIGYYCSAHGSPGSGMIGEIQVEPVSVSLQSFSVD
ncbi:plastocyanin/azurin family copper-binding protein [Tahibacter amnicola]|uniref:Plastocyanin/azurin family copper-binding protein n=1 Tax=Tahibacter amnicola TaxID=2976241 RepID=A0ABY6BBC1_9GAMM|nr:plastocyanin/azurin family copper-binding protein [Tahibacter amnicola]UXI67356.1 plastocyanin/azurin family copper-binding protein [Tahibacter amnicola]